MTQDVHVKIMQYCHGKSSVQQQEGFVHRQTGLNLRKELVNCYIWSIALCGA